jgi:hypothetical protein
MAAHGAKSRTTPSALVLVWLCHCSLAFDLADLQGQAVVVASDDGAVEGAGRTADNVPDGSSFEDATQAGIDSGNTTPVMSDALVTMDSAGGNDGVVTDAGDADAAAQVGDAAQFVDSPGVEDVATMETATPRDASGDATARPDSAVTGVKWCAGNMTASTVYCNDFDEPTSTVKGNWDSVFLSGTDCASLAVPVDAPSPPNSLVLSTPLVATGSTYQEQFAEYPTNVNSETLQFALKISAFDVHAGDISLVRIGYRSGAWSVSFDLAGAGATLYEQVEKSDGGIQSVTHTVQQPPLGVWTTITLTVDSAGNKLSLSYDGNHVTIANDAILNPPSPGATFSTIVGLNYLKGPVQPMTISYDNILISVN